MEWAVEYLAMTASLKGRSSWLMSDWSNAAFVEIIPVSGLILKYGVAVSEEISK